MLLLLQLIGQRMRRHPREYAILFALSLVVTALWVAEPIYSSYAIDVMLQMRDGVAVSLPRLFGVWGALFLAISLTQTFDKYLTWRMMNRTELERSADLYAHVLHLDIAFHTGQKSGEVVKLLDEGAENLAELQRNILADFAPSLLASIAFLAIGFTIQPVLALLLCVLIAGYVGVVVVGSMRTMRLQQAANRLWVQRIGRAYDAVTNIFSVKSGAQERREHASFRDVSDRVFEKQMAVNRRWAGVEAINFFMLTRMLLTALGIYFFVRGGLSLGQWYFFQASFFRVLTPFEILSGLLPFWNKRAGKIRLSEELMRTPMAVRNKADAVILPKISGHIRLENISFAYLDRVPVFDTDVAQEKLEPPPAPTQEPQTEDELERAPEPAHEHITPPASDESKPMAKVLRGISLDIRPGEHIAFVGHSGAGKTTLAMLLNRFYDVTAGRILINGTDLRDLDLQWWRGQIGLVLQENVMFNDSIGENIRYARPGASWDDVREAARKAAASDFIEVLPAGYDTLIGDRGIKLSGGQRQRVAIARAILKNPMIVILDEATSALDSVTERQVQEGIKELIKGRTSCIIAHRLSTVRQVDRIAVFDDGTLIAAAPHEELVKTCGIYREMVELQSRGMLAE